MNTDFQFVDPAHEPVAHYAARSRIEAELSADSSGDLTCQRFLVMELVRTTYGVVRDAQTGRIVRRTPNNDEEILDTRRTRIDHTGQPVRASWRTRTLDAWRAYVEHLRRDDSFPEVTL